MSRITVHHFSDILCIWAYVAEIRVQELRANFGDQVELDYRTLAVFGNVKGKLESAWGSKGGLPGYARHVGEIAAQFNHIAIHPQTWVSRPPSSSFPAHLYLCAARLAERAALAEAGAYERFATQLRLAFFAEALDISDASVIRSILTRASIAVPAVEALIASGEAHAQLAEDMQMAKDLDIRASPTMLFNDGRQRLAGNVGYRIIEANIRELIERPTSQHSWC